MTPTSSPQFLDSVPARNAATPTLDLEGPPVPGPSTLPSSVGSQAVSIEPISDFSSNLLVWSRMLASVGAKDASSKIDSRKRRENDQRTSVLFTDMRDILDMLVQLHGLIEDEKRVRADNQPGTNLIRMQKILWRTTEDIKNCANACDAYAKKNPLVKVLKSSDWEETLEKFNRLFAKRREELTLALLLHNATINANMRTPNRVDPNTRSTMPGVSSNDVSSEERARAALEDRECAPTGLHERILDPEINEVLSEMCSADIHLDTHNLVRRTDVQKEELDRAEDASEVRLDTDTHKSSEEALPSSSLEVLPQEPTNLNHSGGSWNWNPYLESGYSWYSGDSAVQLYRSGPADTTGGVEGD